MAIIRPVTRTIISTLGWGIPITDQVNYLTPTPWVAVSYTNGWGTVPGWQPAQIRKIGDNVQIRGYVQGGSAMNSIFTLPAGYRPPYTLPLTSNTFISGGRQVAMVQVQNNGLMVPEQTGSLDLNFFYSTIN